MGHTHSFPARRFDYKFEFTITGFIREYNRYSFNKIPQVIESLCLQYYIIRNELRDLREKGELNSNFYIIQSRKDVIDINDTSIYKYKWKFKVTKVSYCVDWFEWGIEFSIRDEFCLDPSVPTVYLQRPSIHHKLPKDGDVCEIIFYPKIKQMSVCINGGKTTYRGPHVWKNIKDVRVRTTPYKLNLSIACNICIECIEFSIEQK